MREIEIAGRPVRALRVTYVGELGWELHMPIGDTGEVFDAADGGRRAATGITPAGYRAIESLRLEKGYRAWGSDITPNDNPFEAGLGWAVKLKSGQPFLGREATEKDRRCAAQRSGSTTFTVDDPEIVLAGRETILRDGAPSAISPAPAGATRSAPISGSAMCATPRASAMTISPPGRYELEVATERVPAALHMAPLYDPANARVKG